MPAIDRFFVALALEQFFTALHLGVVAILDLDPCRALRRVRRKAMLGHDAFKIHFANTTVYRVAPRDRRRVKGIEARLTSCGGGTECPKNKNHRLRGYGLAEPSSERHC
jgi:hypothetical protein